MSSLRGPLATKQWQLCLSSMRWPRNISMTETPILQRVRLAVGALNGIRVFRNNTGTGWIGDVASHTPDRIVLLNPRPLRAGLCTGGSDLIGWRTINGVAQFVAIEVKTPTGRATPDQLNFIAAVNSAGGHAGVVRSSDEAINFFRSKP